MHYFNIYFPVEDLVLLLSRKKERLGVFRIRIYLEKPGILTVKDC